MAGEEGKSKSKGFAMKGGDGVYSYARNSSYQGAIIEASKELIKKAIQEKLDISKFPPSNTFRIADLGCSIGTNTFSVVKNIITSLQIKYQNEGPKSQIPEFEVLFNDHPSNDFNTLFQSIPGDKMYFAYGVPGSFYSRLFPKASLGFVHSSFALQILSQVPAEVMKEGGPAWNKGRISYAYAVNQVVEAFCDQYLRDMEKFLSERAEEIAEGGLLGLIVPARPNGTPHSECMYNKVYEIFGSVLVELSNKGRVKKEKVDSFNLPIYIPSPEEIEAAVLKNGAFSVEIMDGLPNTRPSGPSVREIAKMNSLHMRAGMEDFMKEQFGEEILDELFEMYCQKFQEEFELLMTAKATSLFVLLMRNSAH